MEHIAPVVHIGDIPFDLAAILMIIITSAVVMILASLAVRNLSVDKPGKLQNFVEIFRRQYREHRGRL